MDDDYELIQKLNRLDTSVLAEIFDRYYDPIYRYIYVHVSHIETAEDLAAQVFQRLLESIQTGRSPQHYLKAWLFRIAHNLIVDDARRQTYRNHSPLQETIPAQTINIEDKIDTSQLAQQAHLALFQLTDKQRHIITLRYLVGMTPMEIASILAVSVGSVKALQHRGLEALRRELGIYENKENQDG